MAKVVLDIEPSLIEKIKNKAKQNNISLSEWTEILYKKETDNDAATAQEKETEFVVREDVSDWVKSLILAKTPTPDFDAKKEYRDHIMTKYGL